MKIGGLASGMDTGSIIKDLMQANRLPLNKITQKKQYLEWQLDDYRTANRDLKKFSDDIFSNMILSKSFTQKKIDVSSPDALGVKNINSTGDFSGTITVEKLAKNSTMQGGEIKLEDGQNVKVTSTLADLKMVDADGNASITIIVIGADGKMPVDKDGNVGVTLEFSSTDTLQSVINKINKETGVTAFYDSQSGKIAMSTKYGGKLDATDTNKKEIVVSGPLGKALKLEGADVIGGQNAEFTLNGMKMERSSNTFEINGFEFTLKAKTAANVTFSSAPDTDKILDTVVKFVDDYNKLIEDLNSQIREPKYRDFHPLSAAEKAELKEKEIELWEEKAMSGTLRNDPMISSLLSTMRTALMGSVDGEGTLSGIGITTSKDYLENGKLIIDEEALRKAINEDPTKVHELFSKNGDTKAEQGFARRLRDAVEGTEKLISARAGKANSVNETFTLGRNLKDMDKQIERFEARLEMTESRLWKQFTAMEMAIQRANMQSSNLMDAFG